MLAHGPVHPKQGRVQSLALPRACTVALPGQVCAQAGGFYLRQKPGSSNAIKLSISSRPSNMPKVQMAI